MSGSVGVQAGGKAAPAGNTNRILAKSIAEGYGLRLRKRIQKWSLSCWVS